MLSWKNLRCPDAKTHGCIDAKKNVASSSRFTLHSSPSIHHSILTAHLFGFTLAEVLITLGIIGVVCAMTIPTLMNNIQDEQFKAAYKKAYSTASQAWLNAYTNGSLTLCSQWNDDASHTCNTDNFNAFKNEIKVSLDCSNNPTNCWNMSGEKAWQGNYPASNAPAFIDVSGVAWAKMLSGSSAGEVLVDTNGNKPPNQYGRDRAILVFLYTSDVSISTRYPNALNPKISILPDFPLADTSIWDSTGQLNRCPSMNSHPCYYQSWITGAH